MIPTTRSDDRRQGWNQQHEPIHLSLEALFPAECPGVWLAIDMPQSIVTRFHSPQAGQAARVCCHQPLPPNALRTLVPLLRFPESCSYAYLLSALQVPEPLLVNLLTLPLVDPLVSPFFTVVEEIICLLQETTPGIEREQHLRHLRRIMTDTMAGAARLGLTVVSQRRRGYRLQPTVFPQGSYRAELHRAAVPTMMTPPLV